MQSMFSVAAILLASGSMIFGVLGLGASRTPGEPVKTRVGATDVGYAAGWSVADGLRSNVGFGLPRVPRPRMPRPGW
jgi:hypothetical protein